MGLISYIVRLRNGSAVIVSISYWLTNVNAFLKARWKICEFSYRLELAYQITARAVDIIKTKFCISPRRKPCITSLRKRMQPMADDIHLRWWYAIAFAMDKKIRQCETCRIFWQGQKDSILARTARSVFHGRGRPPEVRSVPFPLQIPSPI